MTMTTYLKPVLLVVATGTLLRFISDYLYGGTKDDDATWYTHDNRNLPVVDQCTQEERSRIVSQLVLGSNTTVNFENFHKLNQKEQQWVGCFESEWLDSFFEEEANIGSEDFVGISVGCNKGTDAILAARMGMSNPNYDVPAWLEVIGNLPTLCLTKKQGEIHFPQRKGEMHCIEPMPNNVQSLNEATAELGLEGDGFVVSSAAISSKNGIVKFPQGQAGTEVFSIESCDAVPTPSHCVEVDMYSLDSYVQKFVKSKGPINMLSVDTEGWDFDVLFGGSTTLDRTYYLEFEYHRRGNWANYKLQDAVRLLDGKGFTCYWMYNIGLWRITECYFDVYDVWHGWSNVGCVHRSQTNLAERMETRFKKTLTWVNYPYDH